MRRATRRSARARLASQSLKSRRLGWLKHQNARGQLAVFVGAGVAFGCGLPTWELLIQRLAATASRGPDAEQAIAQFDPITRTRIIRTALGKRFNKAVADALYKDVYTISPAVAAIVAADIRHICTYNFDDLLEEAMMVHGLQFVSVEPGDPLDAAFEGTVIFHPHGMLTANLSAEECGAKRLVLSEEEYHALYSNPYSWANLIQLSLLTTYSCLFVGVSLKDPNIRRLLDTCRALPIAHRHHAIMRAPTAGLQRAARKVEEHLMRAQEADLHSLGVEPVWIEDFAELAGIFRYLRAKPNFDHFLD